MTQPNFLEMPPPRRHRIVRDTSIASYAEGREQFTGRKADVLRWLAAWWNRVQVSPTSAEMAEHEFWISGTDAPPFDNMDAIRLYVRRGLSDLQTHGLVESVEKRPCAVTGRTCRTWRVVSR